MAQPAQSLDAMTELASALNARFAGTDLATRLALVAARANGRIVFMTSLGIEDQAITHAIFTQEAQVVTIRDSILWTAGETRCTNG